MKPVANREAGEREHRWRRQPSGHHAGGIPDHEVEEHDDGTITVSPSIVTSDGWHGWLDRGVWREA